MLEHITTVLLNLTIATLLWWAMSSLGLRASRYAALTFEAPVERVLWSFGLGCALSAYGMFLLGVLQLVYPWLAWVTLVLTLVACWSEARQIIQDLRRLIGQAWRQLNQSMAFRLAVMVVGSSMLIRMMGTLAAPASPDALIYHLTLPKQYMIIHGLGFIAGVQPYGQFPQNVEMLYLWGMLLRTEVVAQLTHWAMGCALAGTVYWLARSKMNRLWSVLAAAIFYAGGEVAAQSGHADIDLAIALFQVLAVMAGLKFLDNRQYKWLAVSALCAGVAGGSKYTGVLIAIPMIMLISWYLVQVWKWPRKVILRSVGMFMAMALLPLLPWLVKNLILVGNPVFPTLQEWFPGRPDVAAVDNLITSGFVPQVAAQKNLAAFLASPFNITFDPSAIIGGSYIGPLFLAIAPVYFLLRARLSPRAKQLLVVSVIYYVLWFWTVPYPRFMLGAVAIQSVCVVECLYHFIQLLPAWASRLTLGFAALWLLLGVGFSVYFHRAAMPYLLGMQSWAENARVRAKAEADFGLYDQIKWLETLLPAETAVLIDDSRGYLLNRPFRVARDLACSCQIEQACLESFLRCLQQDNIRFVLMSNIGNARVPVIEATVERLAKLGEFSIVRQDSVARLYQVKGP